MQLLPKHLAFSLWRRKGKAFCVRQFALRREEPEPEAKCHFRPPEKIPAELAGTSARQKNLGELFSLHNLL